MFTKTADYYDALYHFKDYNEACQKLHAHVQQQLPNAKTFLDIACGTGKHAGILQQWYEVHGLDIDKELLAIARNRCPNLAFYEGDMTQFNLGQKFDVVACLFSSVAYVQTIEKLNKAIANMAAHLNPGGILLLEPWITPENFWVGKLTSNYANLPDLKISWMYISEREGNTSVLDIHYMVGTPTEIKQFTEKHVLGLWTDEEYKTAFRLAGLEPQYEPQGFFGRGLYYAIKS